jgi:hypothetical protein
LGYKLNLGSHSSRPLPRRLVSLRCDPAGPSLPSGRPLSFSQTLRGLSRCGPRSQWLTCRATRWLTAQPLQLGILADCRRASRPLWAARFDVTVNDGGSMGAATTTKGLGRRRPPPTRHQRTWIWTPSQGKHHGQPSLSGGDGGTSAVGYQSGELPSVKAAAREAGIFKAFDRTKRLLEKHASSFTASQKAELQKILKATSPTLP